MTDIQQGLPGDVQQGVDAALNQSLGTQQPTKYDSGVARVPAPQVPLRPADQGDDDDQPQMDGVDTMANAFLAHLLKKDSAATPPQQQPAPGSFADKLAGAAGALSTGLGDMRTGGDPREGHGWLGSVGATLNARNERKDKEQQIKFDQNERLKNDQINIAKANVELRQHALAVQQQEKTIRDETATSGASFMNSLRDNYKVRDNITQDALNDLVTKDPNYLQTHAARITGYEPVYGADGKQKEANGKPVESPVWSIVDLAPGDMSKQHTISAAESAKLASAGVKNVPAGTIMPGSLYNNLDMRAERYGTTLSILNAGKVAPLPDDVKDQMVSALQDPEVQHAVAMQPGSPLAGLYDASNVVDQHIKAAQQQLGAAQQKGDAQAVQAAKQKLASAQATAQNLDKTITSGFTDQERAQYMKEQQAQAKQDEKADQDTARDAETKRHNIADEALKRAEQAGTPEAINDMGQHLADATMTPNQLPKRAKNYNAYWTAADQASWNTYGKPFDGAQSQADFDYAHNTSTQNTLKMVNSITRKGGSLDLANQAAAGLPRMDQQILNKVFNLTTGEFGDPAITNFHTAMLGLADQYAQVMGKGQTSDTGRQQALDLLKEQYSKGQMAGASDYLKKDVLSRKEGTIGTNRYLQKQYYGSNGITATMIAPDGKTTAEIPASQVPAARQKGARIATKEDYASGIVKPVVPAE